MRKFLIPAALVASTLVVAAPAAAQRYHPVPQGHAYGYQGNYGQVRSLQARVDRLQRSIYQLDRRDIISNREARNLMNDANNIEYRLRRAGWNGLSYGEQRDIRNRISRLEYRIARDSRDGRRYAYDNRGYDRDHDGWDHRRERRY